MTQVHDGMAVFGLGYVGLVQAVCLAQDGHRVIGVDHDANKLAGIARAECPFAEPFLAESLTHVVGSGQLQGSLSVVDAISNSNLAFVCVGTPAGAHGEADLSALMTCLDEINAALVVCQKSYTVIVRSTIPPGTMRGRVMPRFTNRGAGSNSGQQTVCLFMPEFLREGSALQDYRHPPKIIVGHDTSALRAKAVVALLYPESHPHCHLVDFETAELIKYTDNSWHALKVCFANEMGALSSVFGVDGRQLMNIFAADRILNVSPAYLKPGMPFGGSCLPKDVAALTYLAKACGLDVPLLAAIGASNDRQLERCLAKVLGAGAIHVGLWGVSFKPGTSDLRNSPALILAEKLLANGLSLSVHDDNIECLALEAILAKESPGLALAISRGQLCVSGLAALQQCKVLVMCHPPKQLPPAQPWQQVIHLHSGCP